VPAPGDFAQEDGRNERDGNGIRGSLGSLRRTELVSRRQLLARAKKEKGRSRDREDLS
jgi:hypothetical protein